MCRTGRYCIKIPKGLDGYASNHRPDIILDTWERKKTKLTIRAYKGLSSELVANQLKRDWHKIGVTLTVELTNQQFGDYLKDYDEGKFDIAILGLARLSNLSYIFLETCTKDGDATRHIHNQKFELMIDNIKLEPDQEKRNPLITHAENYLLAETVGTIVFPLQGLFPVLAKPWLSGIEETIEKHPDHLYR